MEVPVGGMIIFSGSKAHAGIAFIVSVMCLYSSLTL